MLSAMPLFDLPVTRIDGRSVTLSERIMVRTPFCTLRRFDRDPDRQDPPLLVVAPLSGQSPAILRDLVAALVPAFEVHLLGWSDARDVPVGEGSFGLDENIGHILVVLRYLGPGAHVLALCQSAVPALAATALLAQGGEQAQPRSLTLIAGPVDARINPSAVGRMARARPLSFFKTLAMARVPPPYPGWGRRIYPASAQVAGLSLYLARHLREHLELYRKLTGDDGLDAPCHSFLGQYMSVVDLPAEVYLDTIRLVFKEYALARGELSFQGGRVDPSAIARTALMTVEGELDDVAAPGQTHAAHALCSAIPAGRRARHVQAGVGHFGTFHGASWRGDIAPRIIDFLRTMPP